MRWGKFETAVIITVFSLLTSVATSVTAEVLKHSSLALGLAVAFFLAFPVALLIDFLVGDHLAIRDRQAEFMLLWIMAYMMVLALYFLLAEVTASLAELW